MYRRPFSLLIPLILVSAAGLVACGGPAVPEGCATPGASRCEGSVVQACAANAEGVLEWRSGVDCASSGLVCSGGGASAQCVAGGGGGGGGGGNGDGGTTGTDGGHTGSDGGQNTGHCGNGVKDGDESGTDCGGSCGACANGQPCASNEDCQSMKCGGSAAQPVCVTLAANCSDGVKNSDETDVDCGGTCGSCVEGKTCNVHNDCATSVCDLLDTQTCITATPSFTINEDFETGALDKFPYTQQSTSGNDWVIETDAAECHAGSFCLRTNVLHALEETARISVALSVRENSQVSFWARVHTEPNQHVFRFYIDGVEQTSISGDVGWTQYTFPVPATGANGPDRVLTFEYERSAFVDPNHVPWNTVWIDDVDLPDWNTEPTVPQQLAPWNGKLTTSLQPTFRWQSFDADFDPITYELQYDTDPSFSTPVSTGEINQDSFIPTTQLSDETLYYWRVRAKDDSNYRWSAWSATAVVEINSGYEYASVWRQNHPTQFEMNTLQDVAAGPGGVTTSGSSAVNQTKTTSIAHGGGTSSVNFTGLPPCSGTANLNIAASGDFNATSETATVYVDGVNVGTYAPLACNANRNFTFDCSHVADGAIKVDFVTTSGVGNGGCSGQSETWTARTTYNSSMQGTMTSIPIHFGLFDNKALWEKIHVVGDGTITLQVLDAQGALIPDAQIPGNAAGHTERTLRLWDLDPALYPVIRLRATLAPGSTLQEWSVVGNDVHEWLFSHPGDTEGWSAFDTGATPMLTVVDGALRFDSGADGTDPNVQYTFPQPVPASRFTTLEVTVRTSNNYANDNPAFFWQSNFGLFDTRRSFVLQNQFLVTFKELSFDLTQTPAAPAEPWQGNIEKLRLDPVERFLDQAMMPSAGWFEIERIALH